MSQITITHHIDRGLVSGDYITDYLISTGRIVRCKISKMALDEWENPVTTRLLFDKQVLAEHGIEEEELNSYAYKLMRQQDITRMGHLKESFGHFFNTEAEGHHYLMGALSSALTYKGNTAEEKVANAVELLTDFNDLFPSPIISKTLSEAKL